MENFEGGEQNLIKTENFDIPWDGYFTVLQHKEKCPQIKNSQPVSTSFLEERYKNSFKKKVGKIDEMSKKNDDDQEEKKEKKNENSTVVTTETVLEEIKGMFEGKKNEFFNHIKLTEEVKTYLAESKKQFSQLEKSDISAENQAEKLNALKNSIMASKRELLKVLTLSKSKLKESKEKKKFLLRKKEKFEQFWTFVELYKDNLNENWQIFDKKSAKNGPSEWFITRKYINGHAFSIVQNSKIEDENEGSFLILKKRNYFNSKIRSSFFVLSEGVFGIAFRFENAFNFYAFECSSGKEGFLRIRKVKFGISTVKY